MGKDKFLLWIFLVRPKNQENHADTRNTTTPSSSILKGWTQINPKDVLYLSFRYKAMPLPQRSFRVKVLAQFWPTLLPLREFMALELTSTQPLAWRGGSSHEGLWENVCTSSAHDCESKDAQGHHTWHHLSCGSLSANHIRIGIWNTAYMTYKECLASNKPLPWMSNNLQTYFL